MAKKSTKSTKSRSSKIVNHSAWFYPVRGSYLPCSPEGWLIYLCYLLFVSMEVAVSLDLVLNHTANVYVEISQYLLFLLLGYYVLTSVAKKHVRK